MTKQNFTLFYFATIDRPYILNKHDFYVNEAKRRIFSQFDESSFEVEANKKEQEYYEEASVRFNPDYDDEGSIYEQAYHEGISYWLSLNEMKKTVSLALTAGMFHQFDKDLRQKCIHEFSHWLDYKIVSLMFWNIGFPRLIELLEWIGMDIKEKDYYKKIDICRHIINVYKHGDGHAHQELSIAHPEYYYNPGEFSFGLHHEQLEINKAQFIEFADAITDFWNNIPIYCMSSNIRTEPEWLNEEYKKYEKKATKIQIQNDKEGILPI
ncbi:hypothetical protein J7620_09855 [Wohlfahrtiimonas chitiniclastica]|uniref:hypothetical protein n=1 Tax=Wohlfahrtiimonas chitiniclastica TaxID=400946 RepID=UPI001BD0176E|nr:hypothetical protein [Wohlfahrtiimonas chitiniclastica]MBS7835252.1 hypothetical protein [Wohlfahrtiimonas chitiniclastica]